MKLLKSHRDQKCKPYVFKAINYGHYLLEIDIQKAGGEIVLGHNWRPKIKALFRCTLDDYLQRVSAAYRSSSIFIQFDVKEICFTEKERTDFARLLFLHLWAYRGYFTILISANDGWGRPETAKKCFDVLKSHKMDCMMYSDFIKENEIKTFDLWS